MAAECKKIACQEHRHEWFLKKTICRNFQASVLGLSGFADEEINSEAMNPGT
jgi:hypothetical protein